MKSAASDRHNVSDGYSIANLFPPALNTFSTISHVDLSSVWYPVPSQVPLIHEFDFDWAEATRTCPQQQQAQSKASEQSSRAHSFQRRCGLLHSHVLFGHALLAFDTLVR